jgi:two-component system chemotaxis response regulator CheY
MAKILVVDDSPAIRSFIKVFLDSGPYEFVEADNGERAYKLIRVVSIDLVIADINMPVLDGLKFVLKLRACHEQRLRRMPVILLTGDTSAETAARATAVGANFFLRKPVAGDKLRSVVGQALRGHSTAPPSEAPSRRRTTEPNHATQISSFGPAHGARKRR